MITKAQRECEGFLSLVPPIVVCLFPHIRRAIPAVGLPRDDPHLLFAANKLSLILGIPRMVPNRRGR